MLQETVHIAPLGFEHSRIVEPAVKGKADTVILLQYADGDHPEWFSDVKSDLMENGIEVEPNSCNIFDIYSVVHSISRAVDEYEDADVYVNLSTGSSLSAIGGMIACSTTDAIPFYVTPEGYGDPDEEEIKPVSYGYSGVQELTPFPVKAPSEELVWVMEYLRYNDNVSKKELIDFGKGDKEIDPEYGPDDRLPFMDDSEYKDKEQANQNRVGSHIIDPLNDRGWIKTEQVGNSLIIHLTDEGEEIRRAFRHKIE